MSSDRSPSQLQLGVADRGALSVLQDITQVILSRGELSKDDIRLMWGLDDAGYEALKQQLADAKLIEPGPRGTGGFQAKFYRRPLPPAETRTVDVVLGSAWEAAAAERLASLLSHADLEELLGDLVYTLRRARLMETQVDRRGTKLELAAALVTQHGVDLFAESRVRGLVAKKCRVTSPGRWHPGKAGAVRFVEAVEFPAEFAGIPAEETPPDFEYLEGRLDLKPLEDFQVEVQRKLIAELQREAGRAIVTLPTGAGKTRVAVESIRDWLTGRFRARGTGDGNTVLWLAHTEELCEQAYACFREVWTSSSGVCPLLLFRFWGGYTRDFIEHRENLRNVLTRPSVLISTPQRIVRVLEDERAETRAVLADLEATGALVLIDEAHRAAAPSYRRIIQSFSKRRSTLSIIGLTATPFRAEYDQEDPQAGARELKALFGRIIEPIETLGEHARVELERRGCLARPVWSSIETKTLLRAPEAIDPEALSEDDIERIDYALKLRADNPTRRMRVLERMLEIVQAPGSQLIYFGPTVVDAECMAFLLRQKGVAAAFVSGNTRAATRRQIIDRFRAGEYQVLCNCEVLTTGFDAPRVTHVIMARPTVSQVLYEQMIGRGLRGPRFGGTETCEVVDLEDSYKSERPKLGYQQFRELWVKETGRGSRAGRAGGGS